MKKFVRELAAEIIKNFLVNAATNAGTNWGNKLIKPTDPTGIAGEGTKSDTGTTQRRKC